MDPVKFAPIYDMHTAQPIVHSTDIGNHQCNELGDGSMSIATNTVDLAEYDFEALARVHLNPDELYRLYTVLHAYFVARGGQHG